jgi:hypothetical protein
MAERKPFLLRLDPDTMAALRAWAADDLRSLNGQIEFLLRRALRDAGRASSNAARRRGGSPNERIDVTEDEDRAMAAPSKGRGNG